MFNMLASTIPLKDLFSFCRLSVIFSSWDVKMADIHKAYLGALFLAYLFQFQNAALLSSPLLSLLIGSVLARYFQVELASSFTSELRRFPHNRLIFIS